MRQVLVMAVKKPKNPFVPNEEEKRLAATIKARREEKHIDQAVLAKRVGISVRTYQRYEYAVREVKPRTLALLEGVLGQLRLAPPIAAAASAPSVGGDWRHFLAGLAERLDLLGEAPRGIALTRLLDAIAEQERLKLIENKTQDFRERKSKAVDSIKEGREPSSGTGKKSSRERHG